MENGARKPQIEIGIEFVIELLLFLYPYGADQMGLPHNFWLGLGCWIVGAGIAVRMFWIFPAWTKRLTRLEKGLIAFISVAIFVAIFFRPVVNAYHARTGEARGVQEQSKEQAKPSIPVPQMQAQPPLQAPASRSRKNKQVAKVSSSGKGSPAVGSITQGAGSALSFNQKGGVTAGTIIGAIPPPGRVLSAADVARLTPMFAKHPSEILILYAQHDEEAYHLAKQIGDMLTVAGWKLQQPVTETITVSFGGPPSYGIEIGYKGDKVPPGAPVRLDINTAPGLLASALLHFFPKDFSAIPGPTAPDDKILLTVMANPAEKDFGLSRHQ